jgi:acyl-CoA reductase-like NAD-dependent aldehyde dehydrogenase
MIRPTDWPLTRRREALSALCDCLDRCEPGAVHINGGAYEYGSPFGGYKASGNGREGGEMGLEDFLETKMVHGLA